jgi:hypothetical protein
MSKESFFCFFLIEDAMDKEQVMLVLQGMSLEDIIRIHNDLAWDAHCYSSYIKLMSDDSWWNEIFRKHNRECRMIVCDLLYSSDFNIKDKYFQYDEGNCCFTSFNTKEEMYDKGFSDVLTDIAKMIKSE